MTLLVTLALIGALLWWWVIPSYRLPPVSTDIPFSGLPPVAMLFSLVAATLALLCVVVVGAWGRAFGFALVSYLTRRWAVRQRPAEGDTNG